jgi:hypothetical protein
MEGMGRRPQNEKKSDTSYACQPKQIVTGSPDDSPLDEAANGDVRLPKRIIVVPRLRSSAFVFAALRGPSNFDGIHPAQCDFLAK